MAGVTCAFSALAYAELASTIPVSGSLIWLAVGLAIYFAYGRRHSLLRRGQRPDTEPDEPQPA